MAYLSLMRGEEWKVLLSLRRLEGECTRESLNSQKPLREEIETVGGSE